MERIGETKRSCGVRCGVRTVAGGGQTGARTRNAGELEPGMADLDGRRARDQRKHVGYERLEFGFALRVDTDRATRAGICEGAARVCLRHRAGLGNYSEDEYGVWRRSESVCVQVDIIRAQKSQTVF